MAFKFVILSALLAVANAGYLGAPAALGYAAAPAHVSYAAPAVYAHGPVASTAVGSQTQSVSRSHDGNHVVSTYTKAVDTAFSSVRKFDTRVSNDAVAYAPAVAHVAAPAVAAYAAPAYAKVAAPAGLLGVAYSAAPAVAHISYSGAGYGYHY
ncbi:UNVERIFIED_CONTAM: hypothetical protein PYX00_007046 [Menopon gallinae]|uniref:Uncharacterized protein n=1 Tax=Menopon gallinae TaxID=328185 RepID=A0AAW2HI64_9NEOP